MYPIVLFGVIALVVFLLLISANPGNTMMHASVSIFIALILSYFILYQRAVDTKTKKDDFSLFWMFSNKY